MVLEDEGLGCVLSAINCIDGFYFKLEWNVIVGTDYYVVLEYYIGGMDIFNLDVSCCMLDCLVDLCGDDGCGGMCDVCSDG